MQRITIKELVDFRRKTDRTKKSFGYRLISREVKDKSDDASEETGGGDYWVTSTSSIYNVFKYEDESIYDIKIEELRDRFDSTEDTRTQSMYQRNIDIINNFKDFDFTELKPSTQLKYERVPKIFKILTVSNLPLYINPSLLFSFERNGKAEIGGLWLVPKLNGFKKSELGMFCESLYRFLIKNYSETYQIAPDFCVAIDTYNAQQVVYSEMLKGDFPFLIDNTLAEIKGIQ